LAWPFFFIFFNFSEQGGGLGAGTRPREESGWRWMLIMDKEGVAGGRGRKEGRRREGLRGVEGEKKGSRPKRGFGRSRARNDEGQNTYVELGKILGE
jgi:hypothetical protein